MRHNTLTTVVFGENNIHPGGLKNQNLYIANLGPIHSVKRDSKNTLLASIQYLPIYSGFILQIQGASQRPGRQFDVDSVRNHCYGSVLVINEHLLRDRFDP